MSVAVFSNQLFNEIYKICKDRNYSEVLTILSRKHPEGVDEDANHRMIDINQIEAQLIADVAIVEHTQAGLIYPYWSDDHPNYDESHEEQFFEVQSFLQAVLLSLSEFDIKTKGGAMV
ncbi:hypothetical protein MNBD_GAMMA17-2273 [hydrothermal vent metagenome]|uniref:Uncharacterized protein n=1 Tax=hydrothermal vent metagenome TaxID=652676 RepID=A0A3B0ZEC3_9ZZZZ